MTNAFEEIVVLNQPQPSASSSSYVPYDVFINHRGIDVKHTLASDIYDALDRLGLRVFLDKEELQLGDFIPAQIQHAMSTSFLHIAIFSPNYGQSPWCLAELSFMLKTGNKIIPVFYNVDPADLRWACKGKGIYAGAFSEHEDNGRYSAETLEDWKMALHDVSLYNGQMLKNDDDVGRLLKSIVNCVLKHMKKVPLEVAKHPVGLDEAVQDFERSTLEFSQSHHYVKIAGIVGMGGSGKTTMAKEIYNRKSSSFDRCSFLFDVRNAAAKKDLHNKQKKLLQDLGFKDKYLLFDNIEEGKGVLASHLRSLCVFIILDDVDHLDQLDALLPAIDSFGSGSVIIVTSRDFGILKSWGISSIYKMKGLDSDYARQLLCWHAFLQPFPLEGFENLVELFINICNGLPLSLKVFGGQLYRKEKDYWEYELNKISRILPKDIKDTLKLSYDALAVEEQEIFLDIACFFNGEQKHLAIAVWDGSNWSGLHSCEVLENKCLVEFDEENCIRMHDHLRDMGKEIAIRQLPGRLWLPTQISDIEKHATKESVVIRGIKAETSEFYEDLGTTLKFDSQLHLSTKKSKTTIKFQTCLGAIYSSHPQRHTAFQECMELVRCSNKEFRGRRPLELLIVRDNYFRKEFATLSTSLVWLRWIYFHRKSLPSWLSLKNLRVLELHDAENLEELWRVEADLPLELRELIITNGRRFVSFPRSIGHLKHLKKISLTGSFRLGGLPKEFCLLQSLEHLELLNLDSLESLPTRFGDLTNLKHLNLSRCHDLKMLPVSFKQLVHLEYINIEYCYKLTFTSENMDILENMTKLEILSFGGCTELEELPLLPCQGALRELYLLAMLNLKEIPSSIGELSKLRVLEIRGVDLKSLPTSFGNLSCLTTLWITGCSNLESLPHSIGNLSFLTSLRIYGCKKLELLPESVGLLKLLEHLEIRGTALRSVPKEVGQLSNLRHLEVSNCPIRDLPFLSFFSSLSNLEYIELYRTCILKISISGQCCPSLETLRLGENEYLINIKALPISLKELVLRECKKVKSLTGICGLVNLRKLVVSGCEELGELPSFAELVSLKELEIVGSSRKWKKIEGLEHCRSLETLKAETMWKETAGIQSLEQMERLRSVELSACYISAIQPCLLTKSESDMWTIARLKCGQRHSSNAAAMVCFVIKSSSDTKVHLKTSNDRCKTSTMTMGSGKWVWIGVFKHTSWLMAVSHQLVLCPYPHDVQVRGKLVMGEQEKVVEGFFKLLEYFGKSAYSNMLQG